MSPPRKASVTPRPAGVESATTLNEQESPGLTPRFSVIIPSYNSALFLRQAVESALDQVPGPHEVLVQDGGSTDGTLEILRSFGERVAWVSVPDHGQSDALNKALARTTGDVVVWLNADDLLVPGALAAASAAFTSDRDLAFAYGNFDLIDGNGVPLRRYRSSVYSWDRVFAHGCYIFSGSLFIRRDKLLAIGGFDSTLNTCMDFDLLLRLGGVGRSTHLGRTIAQFRMHNDAKSSTIGVDFIREAFNVRRRYMRGSLRLWLFTALGFAEMVALLLTTRLRYSSAWPRHGRGKLL